MKGIIKCAWLENVQNILNNCGLSYIWQQQTFPSIEWLKNMVHEKCKDQYVQSWYSAVREGSKCINYRILKLSHVFEPYLLTLPQKYRTVLTKFRCRNNKLPIEV
jgi:hypothetical protein